MRSAVAEIKGILTEAGVGDEPVGLDIVEPPFLFTMQRQGLIVADALLHPISEADMVADRLELQPSFNTQAHHGGVIQFGVG
jgi:hypothetical protein